MAALATAAASLSDLPDGSVIERILLVRGVERRHKRDGSPYLRLTLADRASGVPAVVWDADGAGAGALQVGCAVQVCGRIGEHPRYGRQVTVDAMHEVEPEQVPWDELLPAPSRPAHELEADLDRLIASVDDVHLRVLLEELLGRDTLPGCRYRHIPAAKYHHHAYPHGLLDHCLAVATMVSAAAAAHPQIDRDLAVCGALLHDIGKLEARRMPGVRRWPVKATASRNERSPMTESHTKRPLLTDEFDRALLLATSHHRTQLRKGSDTPYVAHLLAVTSLMLEMGGSQTEAIGALLHDAVEDGGGPQILEQIRQEFGDDVARIVQANSDTDEDPKPPWPERKRAYITAMATKAPDELRVSLADKLHNARAILLDFRTVGDELWRRFDPGSGDPVRRYYRELYDAFTARADDLGPNAEPLLQELGRTLDELDHLAG